MKRLVLAEDLVRYPPARDDFGHRPRRIDHGKCGACDACGTDVERDVCTRCMHLVPGTPGRWRRDYVDWPCTSAIVLGLIDPREFE
ncbi:MULTISPECIES: hypothetical protein [unclassified Streptomyces]|uniref:hypothetical protein n=1 Tax=unclassified Streptomyces TaxID=2593676 RepID=UPI00037F7FFF|nr:MULTISPECIES: hypothetical protein [unclassified Streptomyces]MYX33439.1 hypothetical protein [Streptomyces sp. SID8377]